VARQLNKLTESERTAALGRLPQWAFATDRDALQRTYKFVDFGSALGFMVRAGLVAEKMDHHPEWFNVYSRVEVWLTTHDAGGVTELDVSMAEAMDKIASATS